MRTLVVLFAALLIGCSEDPRQVIITEQNKDSFIDDIGDLKGLTVGEAQLLVKSQLRSKLSGALAGSNDDSIVGLTVGELIERERQFQADQEAEQAKQEKLAAEAKAKEEAIAAELRKTIQLSVFKKTFRDGDYSDYIIISCAYENASTKDVRAFRGILGFTDLFDSHIYKTRLTISDPVKAGKKGTWVGQIDYNQFVEAEQALRSTDLEDMKVNWLPSSVIFADGTQIGEAEPD